MTTRLSQQIHAALPDEGTVLETIDGLSAEMWHEAAHALQPRLPAYDLVLAAGQGSAPLSEALAELAGNVPIAIASSSAPRGAHYRSDHWCVSQAPFVGRSSALLVSASFAEGLAELELATLVRSAGVTVSGLVTGVEFTSKGGRSRVDMLGVTVIAAVQLAHTPRGLALERRGEGGEILMPLF